MDAIDLVSLLTVPLLWGGTIVRKHARRGYDLVRIKIARIFSFLRNTSPARRPVSFSMLKEICASSPESTMSIAANVTHDFYASSFR
jgi:hypothetical protein